MRRVLVFQHFGCETLGAIAEALQNNQIEWEYVSLAARHGKNPKLDDADGLIVLGGPLSVYEPERYPFLRDEIELVRQAVALGKPVLGICLGSQVLAAVLGATVRPAEAPEIGLHRVNHFCLRIDSRFSLPSRGLLPHVNCYRAAKPLRGGGGDGEATEHGDTPRA